MANPNYVLTRNLLNALATHGVEHAVITPGSRNTPLALACAMEPAVQNWIHHDERSAAFFALGMAKTTRQPVVLVCTSGTAAAEYLPAITEARLARVPLVVLTADRPQELRSVGAPQTIDQVDIYGRAAKWFHEAAVPTSDTELGRYGASLGTQAYLRSVEAPAGPIHINMGFRDPLSPDDIEVDLVSVTPTQPASTGATQVLSVELTGRALIIAGPTDNPIDALPLWCEKSGAVLLADPTSGYRGTSAVSYGDTLARTGLKRLRLEPDVIVMVGAPPTSKALGAYIASHPNVLTVDDAEFRDPHHNSQHIRANPEIFFAQLTDVTCDPTYASAWNLAERRVAEAWKELPFPSEPAVAAGLAQALPDNAQLWVASSMPIRDLDSFFHPTTQRSVRANRGANGIDGFVSSVLGSAAAADGPTFALAGDLSLVYDIGALAAGVRMGLDATFIVINNNGGGIFSFLPQADYPEYFESHLATPHGVDIGAVTRAYGARHVAVDSQEILNVELRSPPSGISVIEISTERGENAALHQELWARAAAAFD